MFNRIAYRNAEREQENLASCVEGRTKDDITDWPPILEGAEDKNQLGDDVNWHTDERPEYVDDVKCNRGGVGESEELFEGGDSDEEGSTEDHQARDSEEL